MKAAEREPGAWVQSLACGTASSAVGTLRGRQEAWFPVLAPTVSDLGPLSAPVWAPASSSIHGDGNAHSTELL